MQAPVAKVIPVAKHRNNIPDESDSGEEMSNSTPDLVARSIALFRNTGIVLGVFFTIFITVVPVVVMALRVAVASQGQKAQAAAIIASIDLFAASISVMVDLAVGIVGAVVFLGLSMNDIPRLILPNLGRMAAIMVILFIGLNLPIVQVVGSVLCAGIAHRKVYMATHVAIPGNDGAGSDRLEAAARTWAILLLSTTPMFVGIFTGVLGRPGEIEWLPSESISIKGETPRTVSILQDNDHVLKVIERNTGRLRIVPQGDITSRTYCEGEANAPAFLSYSLAELIPNESEISNLKRKSESRLPVCPG
ncbi:hypothetical protein [Nonomuraea sp. NPDC049480]|uniref:hypothetical protein n=1 Tax=Nonomuraea sp. NPDC049480 TaxID=3364353 RepID=UPI00379A2B2A